MRPGHIKVFDGLRLTTEHIEHLQDGLHSSLREVRVILGLGRVYDGFETNAEDGHQITVKPGLAFDRQGDRVVSDEPKTLTVEFASGEEAKFVCLKYDQVKGGQVEGQFTMIWDSCAVLLRPALPGPEENLLAIAKVLKPAAADDKLQVVSLLATEPHTPPRATVSEAVELGAARVKVQQTPTASATPAVTASASALDGAPITKLVEPASANQPPAAAAPPAEPASPASQAGWWQIRQGVARLGVESGPGSSLNSMLLEPLKKKLNGSATGVEAELLFILAEQNVALDFRLASISLHTLINAQLNTANGAEAEKPLMNLKCQVTAHGEATFKGAAAVSFGISTTHVMADGTGQPPGPMAELTEHGVAHLPFSAWRQAAEARSPTAAQFPFPALQLLLNTAQTDGSGFKVLVHLLWKGVITTETIRSLEAQNFNFTWELLAAWKALGA